MNRTSGDNLSVSLPNSTTLRIIMTSYSFEDIEGWRTTIFFEVKYTLAGIKGFYQVFSYVLHSFSVPSNLSFNFTILEHLRLDPTLFFSTVDASRKNKTNLNQYYKWLPVHWRSKNKNES